MKMVLRILSALAVLTPWVAVMTLTPTRALANAAVHSSTRSSSRSGIEANAPATKPGRKAEGSIRDPEPLMIVAESGAGGAISPGGTLLVAPGASLQFDVVPDAHHHVSDVLVDGLGAGPVPSYLFADIAEEHTITATFAIDQQTVAVTVEGSGSVGRIPDQPTYDFGDTVELTATPDAGFVFVGWSGDASGSQNPIAIQVDADKAVIATFAPANFTLQASAASGGTISPAGAVSVAPGADQAFTIEASAGHHIDDVRVDGVSVGPLPSYTFTAVTSDHTIDTFFAADTYAVVVDTTVGGTVTRNPDRSAYEHGTTVSLVAVPDPGYRFAGWSGDAAGDDDTLSLVVDGEKHVTATFVEAIPPVVQVLAPNGGETLADGETLEIQWSATDAAFGQVSTVDLEVSRNGLAGPFETIAVGLPNSGTFAWTVVGPISNQVLVQIVAHDEAGNEAMDISDAAASIVSNPVIPIVWLRADSASGTGPPTVPGNASPWVDMAGNHDATLWAFTGTPSSGWKGDGTVASPYRLEFAGEENGINDRVIIPEGSVPELQTVGATTTAVWFKTGFEGTRDHYDYILEWVQVPSVPYDPEFEGRGMSIIVQNGMLQVYANPWINVTPVTPNTWYHVAVVKDTNDMRIYVNGQLLHTGIKSHRGIQESEIVLGASCFRKYENFPFYYNDWFTGAVAQLYIGQGAMTDGQVDDLFQADRDLYFLPGETTMPQPPLDRVVLMRANMASGSTPYTSPGVASPWVDLAGPQTNGALSGFDGTSTSGWQGDGTAGSPYGLSFDGIDDRVTIPARSVTELQNVSAVSAEVWVKPGAEILGTDFRYLLEWLQGQGSSAGLSIAMAEGRLQIFTGNPYWTDVAAISPEAWHHIVVTKEPGEIRVYLDGSRVFAGVYPHIGDQVSEVVLGASTWRGPQVYGDFFPGVVGSLALWQGAMQDSDVVNAYAMDQQFAFGTAGVEKPRRYQRGIHLSAIRPNPVVGRLKVSLALASAAPASIELIDVTGRRVRSLEIGSLGAGQHLVDLGDVHDIHAGVYFLRLTQGGEIATTKATLMR